MIMEFSAVWFRRPAFDYNVEHVPFVPSAEAVAVQQFFRTRQELVQWLFENRRAPICIIAMGERTPERPSYEQKSPWDELPPMNREGWHCWADGDMCIKCDIPVAQGLHVSSRCPPQVYDP
jgi:hypothetical protein